MSRRPPGCRRPQAEEQAWRGTASSRADRRRAVAPSPSSWAWPASRRLRPPSCCARGGAGGRLERSAAETESKNPCRCPQRVQTWADPRADLGRKQRTNKGWKQRCEGNNAAMEETTLPLEAIGTRAH
eukprot:scaffold94365_cov51-Phaeocystis_antarctica.AAC.1